MAAKAPTPLDPEVLRRAPWFHRIIATVLDISACVGIVHLFGKYYPAAKEMPAWAVMIVVILYYLLFETLAGRTPGKFFLGMRIVTTAEKKPFFLRLCIRSLLRVGLLFMMLSLRRVTLLDLLSGCRVLSDRGTAKDNKKVTPLATREGWR